MKRIAVGVATTTDHNGTDTLVVVDNMGSLWTASCVAWPPTEKTFKWLKIPALPQDGEVMDAEKTP